MQIKVVQNSFFWFVLFEEKMAKKTFEFKSNKNHRIKIKKNYFELN
jgi:hypothetical protein